jgi:hypothetical protein
MARKKNNAAPVGAALQTLRLPWGAGQGVTHLIVALSVVWGELESPTKIL